MKKLRITVEGRPYDVTVEVLSDDGVPSNDPTPAGLGVPIAAPTKPAAATAAAPTKPAIRDAKDVLSQVSGVVVSVDSIVGAHVVEGTKLITIEAMKMNTYVMAPFAGTVSEILVTKGTSVLTGDLLVRLS